MATINRVRQMTMEIAFFIALIASFIANPAYGACGTIDSVYHDNAAVNLFFEDIIFSRGDQLLSCNEKFRLEYLSDNVVLIHAASGQVIWEGTTPTEIDYTFYYYGYLDSTTRYPAQLVVQDDGNVVVSRASENGIDTIEWTSNTQGTDCSDTFLPDTVREDIAVNVENSSPEAASIVRANAWDALSRLRSSGHLPYRGVGSSVAMRKPILVSARARVDGVKYGTVTLYPYGLCGQVSFVSSSQSPRRRFGAFMWLQLFTVHASGFGFDS